MHVGKRVGWAVVATLAAMLGVSPASAVEPARSKSAHSKPAPASPTPANSTPANPAPAVDDTQRLAVYRDFRTAFDARQYAQALPIAEKLVSLTEVQYGAEHAALLNPLSNLGTVHFRLGNYAAAEVPYQRAVRIVEARGGGADRQLILPLQGLGETWYAAKEYAEAALALKRAVDISRNLDGLFNVEQLPVLITLIDTYVALDRKTDAEKEHQYAFRVAESNYGSRDERMLGPIDRYARWFEYNGRYTSARALHGRALQLAESIGGPGSLQTVTPLRGIARTHYYEFLYGSEKEAAPPENDPFAPSPIVNNQPHLNGDGEKALRMSVDALTKHAPVNQLLRGETLIDLGDWFMVSGLGFKAQDTYRLAWLDLAAVQGTRRLAAPRQLIYRAPIGSVARSRPSKPDEWDEREVEMSFSVTRAGAVLEPKLMKGEVPENMVKAIASALRKSVYAPRIEAGQAEDSTDVRFVEHMLVKKVAAPGTAKKSGAT